MGFRVTLGELATHFQLSFRGDANCVIDSIATLQNASSGQLAFLSNSKYVHYLSDTHASVVLLSKDQVDACPVNALIAKDPYLSYAKIANYLYPMSSVTMGISDSSVIDESAEIAAGVNIADFVVVGKDVYIAKNVSIASGCVIESGVSIGMNTILKANVTLCHDVEIGQFCLLQAGCVIGSDGFGFANDQGAWLKIPQLGRVCVKDSVEVGANTTIDRGSLEDTIIAQGVKLDNQIQIAHNVVIGENTAIAACTGIAGSTTIGKNCTIAGSVGIVGHLKLVDDVHVTAKSLVTKSLMKSGVYSGNLPAISNKKWKRLVARIKKLDKIVERLKMVEKVVFEQQKK